MIIDTKEAELRLELAYQIASSEMIPVCGYADFLDEVINSTQKTYKYVLFTALLAKSVDETVNAMSLQTGADCQNAYSARTLCAQAVIPFERNRLKNALGGSPSPYTSKPAAVPMIDRSYPARGKAKIILNSICDNLPKISTSAQAFECLIYMVYQLLQKKKTHQKRTPKYNISHSENNLFRLINFINSASQKSFNGETLTLLTAGIYHLQYQSDAKVTVHPVNQCGSSSHQISDLDIFQKRKCILCNELKDKKYTEYDVSFAADKTIDSGVNKMYFIEGYHGEPQSDFKRQIEIEYLNKGFLLKIMSISDFAFNTLNVIDNIDINDFLHFMIKEARNNCFSDEVIEWLLDCANTHFNEKIETLILENHYMQTASHLMN